MKTNNLKFFLLVLLWSVLALQANAQQLGLKKRVAVLSFENKTSSRYSLYSRQYIEQEVADMIITELVKSNQFKVIERTQLDALLKEQDLGNSGVVTSQSAAKIGQVLGAELAVIGAITELGYKKDDKKLGIKGIKVGLGKASAVIAMDIRIVNTSTGEIIAAENIRKKKSGISSNFASNKLQFSDKLQFDESVIGKATRAAVDDVISMLSQSATSIPWTAKVVTNKSGKVYINSGAKDGVQIGMTLKVFRPGEALIDPDTGLNLGVVDEEIGTITILNNEVGEGKASVCQVKNGTSIQRGDIVRLR